MAISRLKTSSVAQGLPKYQKVRAGYDWSPDPNAQYLKLAVPFNSKLGYKDYSADISGVGTNKQVNIGNNVAITSVASKFYGTSLNMGDKTSDGRVMYKNSSDLALTTSDFTIEGWWYPTALNVGYQAFASHAGDSSDQQSGWILIMENNNTGPFFLATNGGGGWPISFASSTLPTLNAWNHIAVTRQGTTFRMFMNGVQTGTQTTSTSILLPTSRELRIGNYMWFPGQEMGFNGYVQDFRLYVGVAKYTANFTTPDRMWLGA